MGTKQSPVTIVWRGQILTCIGNFPRETSKEMDAGVWRCILNQTQPMVCRSVIMMQTLPSPNHNGLGKSVISRFAKVLATDQVLETTHHCLLARNMLKTTPGYKLLS